MNLDFMEVMKEIMTEEGTTNELFSKAIRIYGKIYSKNIEKIKKLRQQKCKECHRNSSYYCHYCINKTIDDFVKGVINGNS